MKRYMRVFLCGGPPNTGKSTWTHHYLLTQENVQRYCLDTFFGDDRYREVAGAVKNIGAHCNRGKLNRDRFLEVAKSIICEGLDNAVGIVDVLIEGYVLNLIGQEVANILREYGCDEIVTIPFKLKYTLNYLGEDIPFKAQGKGDIAKACVASISVMKARDFDRLKKSINYQSFPKFNHKGSSDSPKKFEAAKLDIEDGKSFLDLGCNTGYFCFRASQSTSGRVLGVDRNSDAIRTANSLNHKVFRRQNVEFRDCDIFSLKDELFDIVFCASTFHYFGDKQRDFFSLLHSLLNEGGVAVVEIETWNKPGSPACHRGRRGLSYPNQEWIKQATDGLFTMSVTSSVRQRGSEFPRMFYRLTKRSK